MNHQIFKEMIQLALLNELSDDEMKQLHNHMIDCSDCQAEYDELNKFQAMVGSAQKDEISGQLLQDARRQFRLALDYEISKRSVFEKMSASFRKFFWMYKGPSIAGAFSLAAGLFLGYIFFSPGSSSVGSFIEQGSTPGGMLISNVRFIDPVTNTGDVEFTFDAVKQVKMKGSLKDPAIQKILAEALVNERNPAARLQTVNALSSQQPGKKGPDEKVESALINTLKYDGNPGVRREALKALLNYPYSEQINLALLYVLQNDKNSGMRIGAINALASVKLNGSALDQETMKVLNQKVKNDDNEYVRIRAASLIKEEQLQ